MLTQIVLVAGFLVFGLMAVRAKGLLSAAIWLAVLSLTVALAIYLVGGHEVAVIELSVGAGLVTVLLVLAMSIAGDDAVNAPPVVPRWLALGLALLAVALVGVLAVPQTAPPAAPTAATFSTTLWEQRSADVLLQIVLIFVGLLAVLGLLAESAQETAAQAAMHSEQPEKEAA